MKHCRALLLIPPFFLLCLMGCRATSPPDEAEARQLAATEFSSFCQENGFKAALYKLTEFTNNLNYTTANQGSLFTARYRSSHPDGRIKTEIVIYVFASRRREVSFLDYDE